MAMPPATVCVFVDSTWLDLRPERKAVEAALQRLRETKFVGIEYFGSRDESTHHASLDEVDRSQVYVGIFGGRYGSGITEAEYRRARERGLPCFIYFKDEANILADGRETDLKRADQLAALKEELRHLHTIITFPTPDDLAAKVTADLHRWLFDEYLAPRLEKAAQGEFPLVEAQALLEAIKGLSAPSLNRIAQVMAQGKRTIAVGRDAIQSIFITGDHNVVYQTTTQRYPRLADYIYREFSDLIADTTRWFVGRMKGAQAHLIARSTVCATGSSASLIAANNSAA
jgi:hypothetical protein